MNKYELDAISALRKRFAKQLLVKEIEQVSISNGELHLMLLSEVNSHPATAYAIKDFLIIAGILIPNLKKKIVIVNLSILRE